MPIHGSPRTIPPDVCARLSKILPRLASPFEAEQLATLAAVKRVLTSAGFDLHDLSAAITTPSPPGLPPARPAPGAPAPAPARGARAAADHMEFTAAAVAALVANIRRSGARFGVRANSFLKNLAKGTEREPTVRLSAAQRRFLADLARQAGLRA